MGILMKSMIWICALVVGIFFLLISLWSLMWIFSSFSLAGGYCGNNFSIFNENFKCRQPFIAALVFFIFGILSLVSFFICRKYLKKKISRNKYVLRKTARNCPSSPYMNRAVSSPLGAPGHHATTTTRPWPWP
jgi:ABC-type uncharacterized transport system fused permease/ATPase subunit